MSIRDGFWFHVPDPSSSTASPLVVRKWDKGRSSLTSIKEVEEYRTSLAELWERGLSPYRQSAEKEAVAGAADWEGLTQHVTPSILHNLTRSEEWGITSASCAKEDQDNIPGLSAEETSFDERELGGLGIDLKRTWREGAVGRERTDAAIDRSWALGDLVARWRDIEREWGNVLLGQMEACFIMVLTVANYSCLEEWKRCLGLVLTCRKAIQEREGFFASFLGLLRRQIERCEDVDGGLFDMSDEGGSLLKRWLKGFKRNLSQLLAETEVEDIKEEMDQLEDTLKRMYGWELGDEIVRRGMLELEDGEMVEMEVNETDRDDETGEYAPVIVDMSGTP